jgi:hypothetical protein
VVYTIIPQRWNQAKTFYAQVERIDPAASAQGFTTIFRCLHQHRRHEKARTCPEALAAKAADILERRQVESST